MNDNRNDLLAYLVDLASLGVGLQNLQENREQSEQNDVQAANDRQTAFLLAELKNEFEKQNEKLDKIIELLRFNYEEIMNKISNTDAQKGILAYSKRINYAAVSGRIGDGLAGGRGHGALHEGFIDDDGKLVSTKERLSKLREAEDE